MMTLVLILLVLGAVAGLVLRKHRQAAGTALLVICSILVLVVAVGRIVTSAGGDPHKRLKDEIQIARYVMASEFGRYLATEAAGTQALCVFSLQESGRETIESGLVEGVGGQFPVEFTELERDASDDLDVISMSARKVAAMLDQHPGTDLLITMADLPYEGGELARLLKKRKVRLAATRVLSPATLVPYQRAGVLAGAVAYRDNPANINDVKDNSAEEIFASQYILVPGKRRR